jgi:glycosyltransferase involved in cell wall biosynthesis
MTELSIVLISKNQAWNISRLIESVLQEAECVDSHEVILVDSASTDKTVEMAIRYPVNILRLRPGQKLSPAIGRYVGYQRTQGQFVLFLDGDMELLPGWLESALHVLGDIHDAAVLAGGVIDVLPSETSESAIPLAQAQMDSTDVPSEVRYVGGAALYRRSVLGEVKSFNPFLDSEEESELCLRIRHAGYRILQIDRPMVYHYATGREVGSVPESFSAALSRRKRKFLQGTGQCLRYHLFDGLFRTYARERALWALQSLLWLVVCFAFFSSYGVNREPVWLDLALALLCLPVAAAAWQKRSLRKGFVSVFYRMLMAEGLLRGFLMNPSPPESFSADVQTVKDLRNEERFANKPDDPKPTPNRSSRSVVTGDSAEFDCAACTLAPRQSDE